MLEIERKFLVVPPSSLEEWRERAIEQTYLVSEKGSERPRRSCDEGVWRLWHTRKTSLRAGVNKEREEEISQEEWDALWERRDPDARTVVKTRYVLDKDGLTWELDHFFQPLEMWMLEVELPDEKALESELNAPVTLVREVTHDPRYSNAQIARGACPGGA